MDKVKLKEALEFAKENKLKCIEVDGVKFDVPIELPEHEDSIEGLDDDEMLQDLDVLEQFTDEEVLYWATPYYDELQRTKELKEKQLKETLEVADGD